MVNDIIDSWIMRKIVKFQKNLILILLWQILPLLEILKIVGYWRNIEFLSMKRAKRKIRSLVMCFL